MTLNPKLTFCGVVFTLVIFFSQQVSPILGQDDNNPESIQESVQVPKENIAKEEKCPCIARNVCPRVHGTDPLDFDEIGLVQPCEEDGYVRCCGVSVSVVENTEQSVSADEGLEPNSFLEEAESGEFSTEEKFSDGNEDEETLSQEENPVEISMEDPWLREINSDNGHKNLEENIGQEDDIMPSESSPAMQTVVLQPGGPLRRRLLKLHKQAIGEEQSEQDPISEQGVSLELLGSETATTSYSQGGDSEEKVNANGDSSSGDSSRPRFSPRRRKPLNRIKVDETPDTDKNIDLGELSGNQGGSVEVNQTQTNPASLHVEDSEPAGERRPMSRVVVKPRVNLLRDRIKSPRPVYKSKETKTEESGGKTGNESVTSNGWSPILENPSMKKVSEEEGKLSPGYNSREKEIPLQATIGSEEKSKVLENSSTGKLMPVRPKIRPFKRTKPDSPSDSSSTTGETGASDENENKMDGANEPSQTERENLPYHTFPPEESEMNKGSDTDSSGGEPNVQKGSVAIKKFPIRRLRPAPGKKIETEVKNEISPTTPPSPLKKPSVLRMRRPFSSGTAAPSKNEVELETSTMPSEPNLKLESSQEAGEIANEKKLDIRKRFRGRDRNAYKATTSAPVESTTEGVTVEKNEEASEDTNKDISYLGRKRFKPFRRIPPGQQAPSKEEPKPEITTAYPEPQQEPLSQPQDDGSRVKIRKRLNRLPFMRQPSPAVETLTEAPTVTEAPSQTPTERVRQRGKFFPYRGAGNRQQSDSYQKESSPQPVVEESPATSESPITVISTYSRIRFNNKNNLLNRKRPEEQPEPVATTSPPESTLEAKEPESSRAPTSYGTRTRFGAKRRPAPAPELEVTTSSPPVKFQPSLSEKEEEPIQTDTPTLSESSEESTTSPRKRIRIAKRRRRPQQQASSEQQESFSLISYPAPTEIIGKADNGENVSSHETSPAQQEFSTGLYSPATPEKPKEPISTLHAYSSNDDVETVKKNYDDEDDKSSNKKNDDDDEEEDDDDKSSKNKDHDDDDDEEDDEEYTGYKKGGKYSSEINGDSYDLILNQEIRKSLGSQDTHSPQSSYSLTPEDLDSYEGKQEETPYDPYNQETSPGEEISSYDTPSFADFDDVDKRREEANYDVSTGTRDYSNKESSYDDKYFEEGYEEESRVHAKVLKKNSHRGSSPNKDEGQISLSNVEQSPANPQSSTGSEGSSVRVKSIPMSLRRPSSLFINSSEDTPPARKPTNSPFTPSLQSPRPTYSGQGDLVESVNESVMTLSKVESPSFKEKKKLEDYISSKQSQASTPAPEKRNGRVRVKLVTLKTTTPRPIPGTEVVEEVVDPASPFSSFIFPPYQKSTLTLVPTEAPSAPVQAGYKPIRVRSTTTMPPQVEYQGIEENEMIPAKIQKVSQTTPSPSYVSRTTSSGKGERKKNRFKVDDIAQVSTSELPPVYKAPYRPIATQSPPVNQAVPTQAEVTTSKPQPRIKSPMYVRSTEAPVQRQVPTTSQAPVLLYPVRSPKPVKTTLAPTPAPVKIVSKQPDYAYQERNKKPKVPEPSVDENRGAGVFRVTYHENDVLPPSFAEDNSISYAHSPPANQGNGKIPEPMSKKEKQRFKVSENFGFEKTSPQAKPAPVRPNLSQSDIRRPVLESEREDGGNVKYPVDDGPHKNQGQKVKPAKITTEMPRGKPAQVEVPQPETEHIPNISFPDDKVSQYYQHPTANFAPMTEKPQQTPYALRHSQYGPFPSSEQWTGIPSPSSPKLPEYYEQKKNPSPSKVKFEKDELIHSMRWEHKPAPVEQTEQMNMRIPSLPIFQSYGRPEMEVDAMRVAEPRPPIMQHHMRPEMDLKNIEKRPLLPTKPLLVVAPMRIEPKPMPPPVHRPEPQIKFEEKPSPPLMQRPKMEMKPGRVEQRPTLSHQKVEGNFKQEKSPRLPPRFEMDMPPIRIEQRPILQTLRHPEVEGNFEVEQPPRLPPRFEMDSHPIRVEQQRTQHHARPDFEMEKRPDINFRENEEGFHHHSRPLPSLAHTTIKFGAEFDDEEEVPPRPIQNNLPMLQLPPEPDFQHNHEMKNVGLPPQPNRPLQIPQQQHPAQQQPSMINFSGRPLQSDVVAHLPPSSNNMEFRRPPISPNLGVQSSLPPQPPTEPMFISTLRQPPSPHHQEHGVPHSLMNSPQPPTRPVSYEIKDGELLTPHHSGPANEPPGNAPHHNNNHLQLPSKQQSINIIPQQHPELSGNQQNINVLFGGEPHKQQSNKHVHFPDPPHNVHSEIHNKQPAPAAPSLPPAPHLTHQSTIPSAKENLLQMERPREQLNFQRSPEPNIIVQVDGRPHDAPIMILPHVEETHSPKPVDRPSPTLLGKEALEMKQPSKFGHQTENVFPANFDLGQQVSNIREPLPPPRNNPFEEGFFFPDQQQSIQPGHFGPPPVSQMKPSYYVPFREPSGFQGGEISKLQMAHPPFHHSSLQGSNHAKGNLSPTPYSHPMMHHNGNSAPAHNITSGIPFAQYPINHQGNFINSFYPRPPVQYNTMMMPQGHFGNGQAYPPRFRNPGTRTSRSANLTEEEFEEQVLWETSLGSQTNIETTEDEEHERLFPNEEKIPTSHETLNSLSSSEVANKTLSEAHVAPLSEPNLDPTHQFKSNTEKNESSEIKSNPDSTDLPTQRQQRELNFDTAQQQEAEEGTTRNLKLDLTIEKTFVQDQLPGENTEISLSTPFHESPLSSSPSEEKGFASVKDNFELGKPVKRKSSDVPHQIAGRESSEKRILSEYKKAFMKVKDKNDFKVKTGIKSEKEQQDFVAPTVIQRGFYPILPYSETDPGPIIVPSVMPKVEKFLPPQLELPRETEKSRGESNGASLPLVVGSDPNLQSGSGYPFNHLQDPLFYSGKLLGPSQSNILNPSASKQNYFGSITHNHLN